MKGKNKCKILKEIRQRIADENDNPYVTRECGYQGECKGTCPKCEAELRYLERELEKRRSLGKTVAVAAVAAGLSLSLSACTPGGGSGAGGGSTAAPTLPSPVSPISSSEPELEGEPTELPLAGKFEVSPTIPDDWTVVGELPAEGETTAPEESETVYELEGDVAWSPESPECLPGSNGQ